MSHFPIVASLPVVLPPPSPRPIFARAIRETNPRFLVFLTDGRRRMLSIRQPWRAQPLVLRLKSLHVGPIDTPIEQGQLSARYVVCSRRHSSVLGSYAQGTDGL